ncbi:MAG: PilZ domain-containing protein [Desulfobulbales bacterium]|nr:PilZ domain-containing protein [Desulfobulbales bacterium]
METRKVLVKEGDVIDITCASCLKTKKLSVVQHKESGKRDLRIKCCCNTIFCICLEYRHHFRKPIKLLGRSINLSKKEGRDIVIKNISLGGIGLSPLKNHRTQLNDLLQLKFTLNDSNSTPIEAKAAVKTVIDNYIGCEFEATENFKTSLGFYLLN